MEDVNNRFGPKITNAHTPKKKATKRDIKRKLDDRNRIRRANDIRDWSDALYIAEKRDDPDRTDLIEIYDNMVIDGHIKGILSTLKNKIKAKDFWLMNGKTPDEEAKKLFESKWFSKYLDWSVESRFYGFSLIQLNDPVNGAFENMELIERKYVIPDLGIVKHDITRFSGDMPHDSYDEGIFKDWFIFIGEAKELGLFNNIAPHTISKKHMASALWQFIEIFGMPIRIGKTAIDDPAQKQNMINMLDGMGRAPWGVFGEDDEIEMTESIKGDAAVFIDGIDLANKEISKGMTGVTGMFDEMSLVGSAEVQDSILDNLISSYSREIMYDINGELIPRMQKHAGFGNLEFTWKAEERLSTMDKVEAIVKLTPHYDITPEEVTGATGIEVSEKIVEEPEPTEPIQVPTVSAQVKTLYSTFKL